MTISVIEPAQNARLTTVAAVRALGGSNLPTDDAVIEGLIDQASAAIVSQCGRSFARERISETFRGAQSSVLMLSRWPVAEIVAVNAAAGPIAPDGYELDLPGGLLFRIIGGRAVVWPSSLVTVEYVAGYVLPGATGATLPEDVERAAVLMVRNAWIARGQDPFLRGEDVAGIGSRTYGIPTAFPAEVSDLLAPWRAPQVA